VKKEPIPNSVVKRKKKMNYFQNLDVIHVYYLQNMKFRGFIRRLRKLFKIIKKT